MNLFENKVVQCSTNPSDLIPNKILTSTYERTRAIEPTRFVLDSTLKTLGDAFGIDHISVAGADMSADNSLVLGFTFKDGAHSIIGSPKPFPRKFVPGFNNADWDVSIDEELVRQGTEKIAKKRADNEAAQRSSRAKVDSVNVDMKMGGFLVTVRGNIDAGSCGHVHYQDQFSIDLSLCQGSKVGTCPNPLPIPDPTFIYSDTFQQVCFATANFFNDVWNDLKSIFGVIPAGTVSTCGGLGQALSFPDAIKKNETLWATNLIVDSGVFALEGSLYLDLVLQDQICLHVRFLDGVRLDHCQNFIPAVEGVWLFRPNCASAPRHREIGGVTRGAVYCGLPSSGLQRLFENYGLAMRST